jgi:hypothetical protein
MLLSLASINSILIMILLTIKWMMTIVWIFKNYNKEYWAIKRAQYLVIISFLTLSGDCEGNQMSISMVGNT